MQTLGQAIIMPMSRNLFAVKAFQQFLIQTNRNLCYSQLAEGMPKADERFQVFC